MAITFIPSNYYTYHDGKLWFMAKAGERDSGSKCVRNVGKYKLYADHFECADPYTNYYVADTETGEVHEYLSHYTYIGSALDELVNQVKDYGVEPVPEEKPNPNAFNIFGDM